MRGADRRRDSCRMACVIQFRQPVTERQLTRIIATPGVAVSGAWVHHKYTEGEGGREIDPPTVFGIVIRASDHDGCHGAMSFVNVNRQMDACVPRPRSIRLMYP